MRRVELINKIDETLRKKFGENIIEVRKVKPNRILVKVRSEIIRQVSREIKSLGFDMPVSAGGVDYPAKKIFELFWLIWSSIHDIIIILKTEVSREKPAVESLVDVWKGVQKFERETWELMGINFKGHPKLKPLLLPEDWDYEKEGFPLRKDFSLKPYER